MDLKFVIPLLLMFLIIGVFSLFRKGKKSVVADYDSRESLLTPAELAFYKILTDAVSEDLTIVSKVRIADLLAVRKGLDGSRRQVAQNKINSKHIDFVLCNSTDMKIVAAVELDDSSHNRADRKKRDLFVDSAFLSAEVPLIRFKARRQYNIEEIASIVQMSLRRDGPDPDLVQSLNADLNKTAKFDPEESGDENYHGSTPNCPKCDEPMLIRQGKRGGLKGKKFWGCSNYPKCRAVLPNS